MKQDFGIISLSITSYEIQTTPKSVLKMSKILNWLFITLHFLRTGKEAKCTEWLIDLRMTNIGGLFHFA